MLLLEAPHDGQCIVKHVAVLRGEHRHIKLLRSIGAEVETKGIVVETIVDQVHPLPIALALSYGVRLALTPTHEKQQWGGKINVP
jgi:hypothetical protein